jgi:O-antigen/teichoic acid export membrane protein
VTTESQKAEPKLAHQKLDKKSATKGFGWQFLFTLVNKLVLPIGTLLMAREVGKSVWGLYALMYFVFNAAEVLRDAGLTQTYLREKDVDGRKEGAYMALGVLQSAIPALLLFVFREPIASFFKEPALVNAIGWVSLALLVNGVGTIPRAKVLRAGRLYESGLRETIMGSRLSRSFASMPPSCGRRFGGPAAPWAPMCCSPSIRWQTRP